MSNKAKSCLISWHIELLKYIIFWGEAFLKSSSIYMDKIIIKSAELE